MPDDGRTLTVARELRLARQALEDAELAQEGGLSDRAVVNRLYYAGAAPGATERFCADTDKPLHMPDDRPQWLEAIARELGRRPGVEFAVLFGSRSDGAHRSASDIDVAVKFEDDLPAPERFRRLCSLSGDLQQSDAPFVDVSDIESLPLQVAARAVEGDLLSGDEASFRRYADTIETDYAERRDELRRHNRSVIDRIANGGLRGG